MTGFRRTLLRFAVAALVFAVSACGGGDPAGKLSLNVTLPQNWKNLLDMSVLGAPAGTAYIDTVRTIVDCGEVSPPFWDSPGSSNRLNFNDPKLTGGCYITVQAITAGVVIMEKTQQAVSVASGGVGSLDVQLSEAGGFDFAGTLAWPRMFHSAIATGNDEVLVLGGSLGGSLSTKSIEKVIYSSQGTTTAAFGCSLNNYSNRQKAVYDPLSGWVFVFLEYTDKNSDDKFEAIDSGNEICQSFSLVNYRKRFSPTIFNQIVFLFGGYDAGNQWYINSENISADTQAQIGPSPIGIFNERNGFQCFESGKYAACIGGTDGINFFDNVDTFDLSVEAPKTTLKLSNGKVDFAVTAIAEGMFLVSGGNGSSGILKDIELIDLTTNSTMPFGDVLAVARTRHTSTLLNNGKVLIAGGLTPLGVTKSAEIFDPITNKSHELPWRMRIPRSGHTATLLSDGRVLIVGGNSTDTSIEIFNPPAP